MLYTHCSFRCPTNCITTLYVYTLIFRSHSPQSSQSIPTRRKCRATPTSLPICYTLTSLEHDSTIFVLAWKLVLFSGCTNAQTMNNQGVHVLRLEKTSALRSRSHLVKSCLRSVNIKLSYFKGTLVSKLHHFLRFLYLPTTVSSRLFACHMVSHASIKWDGGRR